MGCHEIVREVRRKDPRRMVLNGHISLPVDCGRGHVRVLDAEHGSEPYISDEVAERRMRKPETLDVIDRSPQVFILRRPVCSLVMLLVPQTGVSATAIADIYSRA